MKPLIDGVAPRRVCRSAAVLFLIACAALWHTAFAQSSTGYSRAGSYSWTAPSGVTAVLVEVWGAGGGGGAASGHPSAGGGGGGGQYASAVLAVVPGTRYAVVVGGGGAGGKNGNDGADGDDSSFAGNAVLARGGTGGSGASNNNGAGAGGTGSVAGGAGTTLYMGGNGAAGSVSGPYSGGGGGGAGSGGVGGNALHDAPGIGTSNSGGDGGQGASSTASGSDGNKAGGGGGGGYAGSSGNRNGGDGADGRVVITPTTLAAAPTVSTGAASAVGSAGATLNGTVSSNGAATLAYFDYGPTTGYGNRIAAAPASLVASASNTAISFALPRLDCETTYHFRAVATNSAGTGVGSDATFTTGSCSLVLTKTTSTTSASVGQYIMFYITATNPSATRDLADITITDVLPTGLSYQSSYAEHGAVAVSGQTVTWTLPTLPAGTSEMLTLVVMPTQKGSYTNSVSSGSVTATAPVVAIGGAWVQYRMDEAAGSWDTDPKLVVDSGIKHLNGTRTNTSSSSQSDPIAPSTTIASQYPAVTGGGFCNAGSFDGKTMVTVPHSDFFQFTTNMSATAWIWPKGYPASNNLYTILSNDVNYEFHIDSNGKLYWWWYLDGAATSMTSASTIPTDRWTHVAIVMDTNSAAKIYINGALDATMTLSGGKKLTANPCGFYIGGDIGTASPPGATCNLIQSRAFQGLIDEAKIYDYSLGAAEVKADMTQGRQCAGSYYDHIQLELNGSASTCNSKTVKVKACMDSGCTALYTGDVTVTLTPDGVWGTNPLTFNGIGTAVIDASKLGGAGTIVIGTKSANPSGNNATTCFNGSGQSCSVNVVVPASCPFDAVESGANPATHLYTKLVDTSFNADILALNGSSVNYNYVGPVAVDLVDASSGSCPTTTGLTPPQTVTFAASNLGRQIATFSVSDASKNVRVRMKGGSPSVSSYVCSYDNFAIRPPSVTLATVEAMATPPSATDAKTVKAGNAFTLRATGPTSYTSALTLDATKLTAQDPAKAVIASGGVVGTLTPATLTANDTTATGNASYSEVGYVYLAAGAYLDSAFTAVDRGNGDCVTDTVGGANLSNTLNGSHMYGCDIGSAAASLGRFVPDHFTTVALGTMDCPSSGMTCPSGSGFAYSGQPLGPITSPARVPLTVAAASSGGGTTLNYHDLFAHAVSLSAVDGSGDTATTNVSVGTLTSNSIAAAAFAETRDPVTSVVTKTSGLAQPAPKFTFKNWPTAPTDVYFRAAEPGDDKVTSYRTPASASVEGGVKMVTGRMKISNKTGSEKQSLDVPVEVDYWSGLAWVQNAKDNVTKFDKTSVNLAAPPSGPSVATKTSATVAAGGVTGTWKITLSAPGSAGSVDLAIDLGTTDTDNSCLTKPGSGLTAVGAPWLRGNWCSAKITPGEADPSGRATFGIYTPENRRTIFIRELY